MAEAKTSGNGAARGQKPNKTEAVKLGQRELGKDAKAADLQKFARDRFGLDIGINHVYNILSEIRKADKKKGGQGSKPQAGKPQAAQTQAAKPATPKPPQPKKAAAAAPAPAPSAAQATPPAPARANTPAGGLALEDIVAAKELLTRVGGERLRALLDVLER